MTTAACTGPSTTRSPSTGRARTRGNAGPDLVGTRVTTFARTLRRRWARRRAALMAVGPEPSGPWAGSDRPDRDRARMLAELRAARP